MAEKRNLHALSPGLMLHWYRVERVLGQGAFGITYLCRDVNLDRSVAIKEYLPGQLAARQGDHSVQAASDEQNDEFHDGLTRFLAEARTLARFEHPNIVRVLNVFEANHTAYMVMHYEQGETLREVLARRKSLPETELRSMLMPLLDGLEHIHAAGFIHRDIKPANIFLRADGSPVLIDFGAARQAVQGHTRTLTNFVSRGYAAIEQYSGKSDRQGPWTDVYGLGATIYRAMTGRMPADAVERSEAISNGTADVMTRTSSLPLTGYSRAFQWAIDRALAFRALDRPQTVAEWRQEFARKDEDVPTGPLPLAANDEGVTEPRDHATTEVLSTAPPSKPAVTATAGGSRRISLLQRPAARAAGGAIVVLIATLAIVLPSANRSGTSTATSGPDAWPGTGSSTNIPGASTGGEPAPDDAAPSPSAGGKDRSGTTQAAQTAPAPVSPGQVAALLGDARDDIDALRLTSPQGNNALDKYQRVLALDPKNAEALQGVGAIADKYIELVYRDLQDDNLAKAQDHLDKAAALARDRPSVQDARAALAARKNSGGAPTTAESTSLKSKVDEFTNRFDKFLKAQKENPAQESRADQLRDRLGGH